MQPPILFSGATLVAYHCMQWVHMNAHQNGVPDSMRSAPQGASWSSGEDGLPDPIRSDPIRPEPTRPGRLGMACGGCRGTVPAEGEDAAARMPAGLHQRAEAADRAAPTASPRHPGGAVPARCRPPAPPARQRRRGSLPGAGILLRAGLPRLSVGAWRIRLARYAGPFPPAGPARPRWSTIHSAAGIGPAAAGGRRGRGCGGHRQPPMLGLSRPPRAANGSGGSAIRASAWGRATLPAISARILARTGPRCRPLPATRYAVLAERNG
jgi:hypothetical protein